MDDMYGLLGPGQGYGGLLGDGSPAMGYMSRMMDPRTQAMLAMGMSMLANSGPSAQPKSLGQIVGQSGMVGLDTFNKGRHIAVQNALVKRKFQKDAREEKMREQVGQLIKKYSAGEIGPDELSGALGQIPGMENEALRVASAAKAPPKAPVTRERKEGDQIIEEQWDASQGRYVEVSRAPRYKDESPSVSAVVAPILAKVANGEPLTPGEQSVLDYQARVHELDQLLRREAGDMDFTRVPEAPRDVPEQRGNVDTSQVLQEARDAIAKGADPAKVQARLRELGVDPSALNARPVTGATTR